MMTTTIQDCLLALKFQKVHENAVIPTYAHETDAGMDVYAVEDVTIEPGQTVLIRTGLKAQIPEGFEIQVRPRSGMSLKTKLRIANAPGTVDSGYRDEICIIAENTDFGQWTAIEVQEGICKEDFIRGENIVIKKGDRIAQFVVSAVAKLLVLEVKEVSSDGDRGGGFGSTGK